jgi:hypothetical protein
MKKVKRIAVVIIEALLTLILDINARLEMTVEVPFL